MTINPLMAARMHNSLSVVVHSHVILLFIIKLFALQAAFSVQMLHLLVYPVAFHLTMPLMINYLLKIEWI